MIGQLQSFAIGAQHGDNPDTNGNGVGIQVIDGYPAYQGGQVIDCLIASGAPALSATATVTCAAAYVQVVDGAMDFGDIGPGESKFSLDSSKIRTTMVPPPPRNQGILFRLVYTDARGVRHEVEGVPKFCGENPRSLCP